MDQHGTDHVVPGSSQDAGNHADIVSVDGSQIFESQILEDDIGHEDIEHRFFSFWAP
jgi:hypothetical protein